VASAPTEESGVSLGDLSANDFELFGVAEQQQQDSEALQARWKMLQKQAHPDRFALQGGAAQRLALQWSVRINEAYQRLRDPLQRAAYLCELRGHTVDAERNTAMPAEFLHQQIEWREALDEARTPAQLQGLRTEWAQVQAQWLADCENLLDRLHQPALAVQKVRALMFMQRLDAQARALQDRIDDETYP